MGRRRKGRGRELNGILLLDKPTGISSNAALQQCKRLFDANKAGHTGSLDVPASGLLPICFGESTKISAFLLEADKRYEALVQLGSMTTTGDAQGEIVESQAVPAFTDERIQQVLAQFIGEMDQTPPMYSAIKQDGVPLYKLAYQGKVIDRPARRVNILELRGALCKPDLLALDVKCSKGTYIRTLAEDIGRSLGCGGHISSLRRTVSGPFELAAAREPSELYELAELGQDKLDAVLIPSDQALSDMPELLVGPDSAWYLGRGQAVQVAGTPDSGLLRLYSEEEGFLGIGEVHEDGRVAMKRQIRG